MKSRLPRCLDTMTEAERYQWHHGRHPVAWVFLRAWCWDVRRSGQDADVWPVALLEALCAGRELDPVDLRAGACAILGQRYGEGWRDALSNRWASCWAWWLNGAPPLAAACGAAFSVLFEEGVGPRADGRWDLAAQWFDDAVTGRLARQFPPEEWDLLGQLQAWALEARALEDARILGADTCSDAFFSGRECYGPGISADCGPGAFWWGGPFCAPSRDLDGCFVSLDGEALSQRVAGRYAEAFVPRRARRRFVEIPRGGVIPWLVHRAAPCASGRWCARVTVRFGRRRSLGARRVGGGACALGTGRADCGASW